MLFQRVIFILSVGVGDFSVWEFSGNPVYFCCYDYFAANDPTSIHVIVFSLEEPYEIQLNQVIFWLNFLKSLVPVEEPIGKPAHPGGECPSRGPLSHLGDLQLGANSEASLVAASCDKIPTLDVSAGNCYMIAFSCLRDQV